MGHQHMRTFFLLAVAALIGGCDATEQLLGICEDCVDGVDLAVTELTVEGPEFVDALDSDVIAAGDTVEVTVYIRNRGREDAEVADLEVCVTEARCSSLSYLAGTIVEVPAINGGETTQKTVSVEIPVDESSRATTVRAELHTGFGDVESSNDSRTLPLRVERPDLQPALELLASEAKIATQLSAVVRVTNGAHVADASVTTAYVCNFPDSWTAACDALDRVTVETPRLPAGSTFVDTAYYTVSESLLYRLWEGTDVLLGLCVDVDGAVSEEDEDNCLSQAYTAQPNFEHSCGTALLPTDGTVSGELSADDCSLYYDNYADVFAFDAVGGTEVNVTLDSFGGSYSLDVRVTTERGSELASYPLSPGELATFTIASGGSYYLVVSDDSSGGYAFTVNVN